MFACGFSVEHDCIPNVQYLAKLRLASTIVTKEAKNLRPLDRD